MAIKNLIDNDKYYGLYEIEENGKDSYKLNAYDILVKADSNGGGTRKGRKFFTLLISFKNKDTMQVALEGNADVIELTRMNPDMANSMLGDE